MLWPWLHFGQKWTEYWKPPFKWKVHTIKPREVTHIIKTNGVVPLEWVAVLQEILKHGSRLKIKILKSNFLTEPKFSGFCMAKTPKIAKFVKNGSLFQEKSLKVAIFFCHNDP